MAKTIEDYKREYAAAKAAGDAAGMQAANEGANALRLQSGEAPQYASADIAKVARTTQTPSNSTLPTYKSGSVNGVSWEGGTDYSAILGNAMNSGNTDVEWLQGLLNSRTAKATYNPELNQYANDDFAREAQAYIDELMRRQTPQYQGSSWDVTSESLVNQLLGMSYEDWVQSDQYKALADRYGQYGRMGMQDMLGQISSRTGGLASSYATTAAQQQYNEYMAQLEEIARQMYSGERSDLMQNAQLAQGMADRDYNRYLDGVNQFYADRDYTYQTSRDKISDSRYEQQYTDSRNDLAYDREQSQRAEARDRINAYLAAYGRASDLDPALIAQSGYTQTELAQQERYYADLKAQEQAAAARKKTGSGGGGNGGKTGVWDTIMAMNDENQVKDYLLSSGLSQWEAKEYLAMWKAERKASNIPTFSNYDEAVAYMKENGVPNGEASGVMTRSEWLQRKGAHRQTGQGGAEVSLFDSYQDYLTFFVMDAIQQNSGK